MKKAPDLTRWNHAGLDRFRYVNGNAATYLEELRRLLAESFREEWKELSQSDEDVDVNQRNTRMLAQYQGERKDLVWEIVRTFARACYMLTEHIDAYANESYLGTATQWDNLYRLVKMLDYHPKPPASASTLLVLQAKPGKSGIVKQGFQVKNAPEDGSAPVIFETLEDIVIDSALNEIRLEGWNHSPDLPTDWKWVKETGEGIADLNLSAGQPALLLNDANPSNIQAVSAHINKVDLAKGIIELKADQQQITGWEEWKRGYIRLLGGPQAVRRLQLNGDGVVKFKQAHGLSTGQVVAWKDTAWHCSRIIESDELSIRLCPLPDTKPITSTSIYLANQITRPAQIQFRFAINFITAFWWDGNQFQALKLKDSQAVGDYQSEPAKQPSYNLVDNPCINAIFIIDANSKPVGEIIAINPPEFILDGKPGKQLKTGVWVIGEFDKANKKYTALKIGSVDERENSFVITFDPTTPIDQNITSLNRLIGPFQHILYPKDFNVNHDPLEGKSLPIALNEANAVLEVLKKGQRIVLERLSEKDPKVLVTTITTIDKVGKKVQLADTLDNKDNQGFTLGTTVIRGNVVRAGHGERRPEKILGSGLGTLSYQIFVFDTADVSFVADPILASGLRADIAVKVAEQRWQEVFSLRDSEPVDTHYTVRMTEEGYLQIGFGDGVNGCRLPTGTDNVRIAYRVGVGLRGNVPAGSLQTIARPHPLVESVRQPLEATGGGDLEDKQSLRESAPASLATIERAVTLEDFANLACSRSDVWDARSFHEPTLGDRCQGVRVVVVPAGGGDLNEHEKNELRDFLQTQALPYVRVQVERYQDTYISLNIRLSIDTAAFDPETVQANVRAALFEAFSLRRRKLGQALYIGEVYRVVERVRGVANSVCDIPKDNLNGLEVLLKGPDEKPLIVRPGLDQVLYLHRDKSTLVLEP